MKLVSAVLVALSLCAFLSCCSAPGGRAGPTAVSMAVVHDLTTMETLRTRFNRDRGSYRLVLLLSPT